MIEGKASEERREGMQTRDDKQASFGDWALAQRTRPNEVLEKIDALVDLGEAERRLEATYSALGRPGHRAAVLLRIMLLQHLYGLSDPQAEAQLGDRLSFQKFAGLRAGEAVPDETAICRFRQRMIEARLHEGLLELLNQQLAAAGYLVKRTTLVDATLVESSRTRPDHQVALAGQAPDVDARYTRKEHRRYYGYKAHVSVDGDNQLIDRARITPANVDDSQVFAELISSPTQAVYADKIYDTLANKAWLAERGLTNGILKKSHRYHKLTAQDLERNRAKSRHRQGIERVFAHFKKWQHYRRVRYLGLVKNQLELTLKAVTYNLQRLVTLATA
jgi:IS5 family transposase